MKPFHHSILAVLVFATAVHAENFGPAAIRLWPEGATPYAKESDAETGRPVLYHYPAADDERRNGCAVVVCPGGGYGGLAVDHEGNQIARWLNDHGIAAFVLHYRLGKFGHHFPTQLADVQRAVRTVRAKAAEWEVDPRRIGAIGFSAGGHLVSMAVTKFDEKAYEASDAIDEVSARPDFGVLCYAVTSMEPGIGHMGSRRNLLGPEKADDEAAARHVSSELNVTPGTPPVFLFHTGEDTAVPSENAVRFYLALREHGVPAEMHIYESGPHGVGLYHGDPVLKTWSYHLHDWIRNSGFLTEAKNIRRVAIGGEATLDGEPVSWGSVTFFPVDGNLPETTVRIRNGKFRADESTGPVAARSRVLFAASIWERTRDPGDGVVLLGSRAQEAGVPEEIDVKAGIEPLRFELKTR